MRQIRPPPLSQHLREFASRRDAWVVLARNMIPVVGIYAFGWSAAISVFNYWFDGSNRAGRDRRGDGSARVARNAIRKGSRDIGR